LEAGAGKAKAGDAMDEVRERSAKVTHFVAVRQYRNMFRREHIDQKARPIPTLEGYILS
jgi:hypothetical protein